VQIGTPISNLILAVGTPSGAEEGAMSILNHHGKVAFAGALALAALALAAWPTPALGQVSGAIFTTDSSGGGTNVNIYTRPEDVYLDGGPGKAGAAGLPPGWYHVQVTEPDGTLLGTSVPATNPTPVLVTSTGDFAECYQLWSIVMRAGNPHRRGYDATGNPGGEYKVWVSRNPAFPNAESKTDNFKIKKRKGRTEPPPQTEIRAFKFYDANLDGAQGSFTAEPPIPDWHVELRRTADNSLVSCGLTDGGGEIRFLVDQDGSTAYTVMEVMVPDWVNTTPLTVQLVANQALYEASFGNVALGPATWGMGRTPGFWQNQNGMELLAACDPEWRTVINELFLVWPDGTRLQIPTPGDGASFETAHAVLSEWIVGTGALGNMAYILSRQLAAAALNVDCGPMSEYAAVFVEWQGSWTSLVDLFAEASALLYAFPLTEGSATDPAIVAARAAQEAIKNLLDGMNSNLEPVRVVLPGPVPFTPIPCGGT
jgi:hypothetical protein